MSTLPALLAVPSQAALAFTADLGWHLVESPAQWWLDVQDELLNADVPPLELCSRS